MTEFWHDARSDMLIYDLPDPQRVIQHVPKAIRLTNGYVAVPRTLDNLQLLRCFDLPVPAPMTDYDWPIKAPFRPRAHQQTMANFMVLHPRCFNLSDMGTMKTLSTLWAADYVMQKNPGWKALIVCPLSIMQRVWADAIFNHFLGRRKCVIVHGTAEKRRKLLAQPADFYIINFDGVGIGAKVTRRGVVLEGLSRDIAERQDIAVVIIDEASAYRAGNIRRHRVARAVLGPKPYLWPLTGTPTPNGPLDAHGLARLVNQAFGESFTAYKNRVMYPLGPWKWAPKQGAHIEARKLLTPSIRFEMRECTDVPPCTEQMRDVELSDEQAALIKKLKRDLTLDLQNGKQVTAAHEAALRLKLIQISCGAVYDTQHSTTRLDCSPRLAVLREVIEEAARKVIVFTPLTSVIHLLHAELKDEYSCAVINGEVKVRDRDAIVQQFQTAENPQVLIADPATMSHGLDLFAASVVVWYGATDRTELYLQANRRIDRPGQTVPTTVVQLAATAIERNLPARRQQHVDAGSYSRYGEGAMNWYNEVDPYAAQWLRNLIAAGLIPPGDVDERSVADVQAADLRGYAQCHFFAGIGGWSVALRLARWPADKPVWTGSCPCQPFSVAGRREGFADPRHLWPKWFRLIRECRPPTIFGEQVAGAIRGGWLDAVYSSLEGEGYSLGSAVLPACGVGAPHIRQRLWFVADAQCGAAERHGYDVAGAPRSASGEARQRQRLRDDAGAGSEPRLMADADGWHPSTEGLQRGGKYGQRAEDGRVVRSVVNPASEQVGLPGCARQPRTTTGELADARHEQAGRSARPGEAQSGRPLGDIAGRGFWHDCDWLPCTDGKARPVEPGSFPLAHGVQRRASKLRAYGNAIVPQVAAAFIEATGV